MQLPLNRSPIQMAFLHEAELSKLIEDAYEQAYQNQRNREQVLWENRRAKPDDPHR